MDFPGVPYSITTESGFFLLAEELLQGTAATQSKTLRNWSVSASFVAQDCPLLK